MSSKTTKKNKFARVVVVGPSDTFDIILDAHPEGVSIEGYLGLENREHSSYCNYKYLGSDEYIQLCDKNISIAIATYSNAARKKLFRLCADRQLKVIGAIHPTSCISSSAEIGEGSFILPGSIVSTLAEISMGVIVGYGALVGHDVCIGPFSFISPGVRLLGGAKIGSQVLIGANAVVLPNVRIGDNVKISAGCIIHRDIHSNSIVMNVANNRILRNSDESC